LKENMRSEVPRKEDSNDDLKLFRFEKEIFYLER